MFAVRLLNLSLAVLRYSLLHTYTVSNISFQFSSELASLLRGFTHLRFKLLMAFHSA
jgi:hypothetical protein